MKSSVYYCQHKLINKFGLGMRLVLLSPPCLSLDFLRGKSFTLPSKLSGSCWRWGGRGEGCPALSKAGEGAHVEHSRSMSWLAPSRFRGSETLPPRRNLMTLLAALVLLTSNLAFLAGGPCFPPCVLECRLLRLCIFLEGVCSLEQLSSPIDFVLSIFAIFL